MGKWSELTALEKARIIRFALDNGVSDINTIRDTYNIYSKGGSIHIDPSKKGTFTAAATKHGKSVQEFARQVLANKENYSSTMVKKANFARNAAHWHDEGGGIKNYARKQLYRNIYPSGYESAAKRIAAALVGKPDPLFTEQVSALNSGKLPEDYDNQIRYRDDLFATYLGIPQNERRQFEGRVPLIQSNYTPTIGGNAQSTYYTFPKNSIPWEDIIKDAAPSGLIGTEFYSSGLGYGQNKTSDTFYNALGEHTVGKGRDTKGDYVSYYDKWDISPFGSGDSEDLREKNANKEDASIGIGTPVQIYDRMYLDDYYGVPKDKRGGYYLPEITVEPSQTFVGGATTLSTGGPLYPFSFRQIPAVRYKGGGFISKIFGKQKSKPVEPIMPTKQQIVDIAWQNENPTNRGLQPDGTYIPYEDPNGRGMDVGPGLLLGEAIPIKDRYTKEELDEYAYRYGLVSLDSISNAYNTTFGTQSYPTPFDTVSVQPKLLMMDTRYQNGSLPTSGWPSLYKAVSEGNWAEAIRQTRSTFKDKKGVKHYDNDRVRRRAETIFPNMFDVFFKKDSSELPVVTKKKGT